MGTIHRFIDVKPPFFNEETSEIVVDDEGYPVDLLGAQNKGNAKKALFCFPQDQEIHRLFVQINKMSPSFALKFFQGLFSLQQVMEEFGAIDVNLHTEESAVDQMLLLPVLKSIDIKIYRPNPTGLNRYEEMVLEELKVQRAQVLNHRLSSRGESIDPNEKTQNYMRAASNLGKVEVKAIDENKKHLILNTERFPVVEDATAIKKEQEGSVLIRAAIQLWNKIKRLN